MNLFEGIKEILMITVFPTLEETRNNHSLEGEKLILVCSVGGFSQWSPGCQAEGDWRGRSLQRAIQEAER